MVISQSPLVSDLTVRRLNRRYPAQADPATKNRISEKSKTEYGPMTKGTMKLSDQPNAASRAAKMPINMEGVTLRRVSAGRTERVLFSSLY